ncbi:MAG: DUF4140 domain-containing protein [bacterium]|nr:DUF4140 domain-containing protein [bacterium]
MKKLFCTGMFLLGAIAAQASDMAVTVYNNNLGVISETRSLDIKQGRNRLSFTDVPALIDAASVRVELPGGNNKLTILEQNYAYDLVSPEQMYQKYIDEQIEIVDEDGKLYSGKLLAYSGGAITLMDASGKVKIVTSAKVTEVSFPALPEGLITRPTLNWLYNSSTSGKVDLRVGYQTSGLSWNAEYVGVLDEKETSLGLSGWSSINNFSGKSYKDASLKLIAGDISRANQPPQPIYKGRMELSATADAAGFEEKQFFEYHMYTLPRKATVLDKEIKQLSLFDPAKASVRKVYVYKPEENQKQVAVAVKFKNSEQTGLGMPLPAGRVRLFKADTDGALVLLGEDLIDHTPKDEEVNLRVGYAFDIAAEERMMTQTRISDRVEERDFEIEFRNHKKETVTISVEKNLYGSVEVKQADFQYKLKDANTLTFDITVPPDQTVISKYKVRISW